MPLLHRRWRRNVRPYLELGRRSGLDGSRERRESRADADAAVGAGYAVWLRLPGHEGRQQSINIVEVRQGGPVVRFPGVRCPESQRSDQPFALFTLSRAGEAHAGAVRVCVNEADCARGHYLEPGRRQLLAAPRLAFRMSDIREFARGECSFSLHSTPALPPEAEFWIYLATIGGT
jgi:hypothetical protein